MFYALFFTSALSWNLLFKTRVLHELWQHWLLSTDWKNKNEHSTWVTQECQGVLNRIFVLHITYPWLPQYYRCQFFPQSINHCIEIHSSFCSWKKSATAEYVDHKIMMQIKLVKYGIFLHSCDGSLTLVNKLNSWTNVQGYICIRGAFLESHMPNPSPPPPHKRGKTRVSRIFASFNSIEWERELEIFSKRL